MNRPEENRKQSRILMLRPHPWAHHPVFPADALDDGQPGSTRATAASRSTRGDGYQGHTGHTRARVSAWGRYLADQLAALERHVQRFATRPPWSP
jgi:hypothetical protein